MIPTPTGLIVIVLGIWCQFGDARRILVSMLVMTLFEAASAADLVGLGGASLTPAKLFLGFLLIRLLSLRGGWRAALAELAPQRVLFVYLLLVVWVLASAVFLPRLSEGMVQVYSLSRSEMDDGSVPLHPSGGNITQAVYAFGGFALTLAVCVFARRPGAYAALLKGLLLVTGLDIFFAIADLVTYATHTGFLLDVFHTGNYIFLTDDVSGGMKRISGSFSETSAFAAFSLELLAVNLTLFLKRVRPWLTGGYSMALTVLLFLSTSSTAYAGLAAVSVGLVGYAALALLWRGDARPLKVVAMATAVGMALVCLAFLAMPSLLTAIWEIIDVAILQKGETDSALERGAMNEQAMRLFAETWGAGVGIGSTRASNFFLVLASNLGIPGIVLFALLIGALALRKLRPGLSSEDLKVVAAARVGMLASFIPAALINTVFDLGTLFYVLAGIAASGVASRRSRTADAPHEARSRAAPVAAMR